MQILYPPMYNELKELCNHANEELIIVSPWIKLNTVVSYILKEDGTIPAKCLVFMRGDIADFLSGSSDIDAVEKLLALGARIYLASNIHAKMYIADRISAIIASSNLTSSGFEDNVEMGVLVRDREQIAELATKIEEWLSNGKCVDSRWLNLIKQEIRFRNDQYSNVKSKIKTLERSIHKSQLRGSRINISRPRLSKSKPSFSMKIGLSSVSSEDYKVKSVPYVPHKFGPYRHISENQSWADEIRGWNVNVVNRNGQDWSRLLVNFFALALSWLPADALCCTHFNIHAHCISLTILDKVLAGLVIRQASDDEAKPLSYTGRVLLYSSRPPFAHEQLPSLIYPSSTIASSISYNWPQLINLTTEADRWEDYALAVDRLYYNAINKIKQKQKNGKEAQTHFRCAEGTGDTMRSYLIHRMLEIPCDE